MARPDQSSLSRDTPWVIAGALGFLAVLIVLVGNTAGWWTPAPAPALNDGFMIRTFRERGALMKYAVWLPPSARGGAAVADRGPWPAVVFLHGDDERGTEAVLPTQVGLGPALLAQPQRWPAVVIFPQLKPGETWTRRVDLIEATLEAAADDFAIDKARVTLTGVGAGGAGVWEAASQQPELWAGLAPVAAPKREIAFGPVSKRRVWIAHGQRDALHPAADARGMADALKAAGGAPTITVYADADHACWDAFYRDEAVAAWLTGAGPGP